MRRSLVRSLACLVVASASACAATPASSGLDEGRATDRATSALAPIPPVEPPAVDESLACETDDDCTITFYRSYVEDASECYCAIGCPGSGVALNVETAAENQASWVASCGGPTFPRCRPMACPMIYIRETAKCSAGACTKVRGWPGPISDL